MGALAKTETRPRRRQAEIREFRRNSLLRAALVTVAEFDIEGATVARICARAGASRGLISHYFSNKEELLVAALHGLFDEAQALKEKIAADSALSVIERIRRIAHSSFEAPIYSWETAAAWQAFTNASRHNPVYQSAIRRSTQQAIATATPLFDKLSAEKTLRGSPDESAMGLFILIDGLWNNLATGKDDLQPRQATALCDIYIDGCLQTT
ncbi:MAG: TetR family transcriptional regulator C-terminal domain-containing protein [Gammaproteobacteria bacterium]|nr:MAG: TetR family transcriptional regulator C-terminal domain-containing protein [Gammaproteobacteria bacterium]